MQLSDSGLTIPAELVVHLTPEGSESLAFRRPGDISWTSSLGWLDWAKAELLREWNGHSPSWDPGDET